jgi:hypothetical protein
MRRSVLPRVGVRRDAGATDFNTVIYSRKEVLRNKNEGDVAIVFVPYRATTRKQNVNRQQVLANIFFMRTQNTSQASC